MFFQIRFVNRLFQYETALGVLTFSFRSSPRTVRLLFKKNPEADATCFSLYRQGRGQTQVTSQF